MTPGAQYFAAQQQNLQSFLKADLILNNPLLEKLAKFASWIIHYNSSTFFLEYKCIITIGAAEEFWAEIVSQNISYNLLELTIWH